MSAKRLGRKSEQAEWESMWGSYVDSVRLGDELRADAIAVDIMSWHEQRGWPCPKAVVERFARLGRLHELVAELTQADRRSGLVFVPDVVTAAVEVGLASADEVPTMLVSLARGGRLELRPESGLGRLSAAERGLCPVAPDGRTPLSWARVL